jgi:hypothetical protein
MKNKNIQIWAVVVFVLIGLAWAAYVFGCGNHDERIGKYQIHLPLGSFVEKFVESANGTAFVVHSWSFRQWTWTMLYGHIGTREDGEPWQSGFPDVQCVNHATIGPVTSIAINGVPFEKVNWSAKSANVFPLSTRGAPPPWVDAMWGFGIRSVANKNPKESVRFDAFCFNQQALADLENIVLTLKHYRNES